MNKNQLLLVFYILGGVAFLFYAVKLYGTDPATSEEPFLKCPVHWSTGFKCPGCGSQRAVHHLMHGDVKTAFQWNALLVISLPYVLLGFTISKIKTLKPLYYSAISTWVIIVVIILYTIIRNTDLYPLH